MIVSTTNDVAGFKVVRHLGVVRGITVRSRSVVGNLVGGLQSVFGGKLSIYVNLAETARPSIGAIRLRLVATKGGHAGDLRGPDGKYLPEVLLDLDYWALIPR